MGAPGPYRPRTKASRHASHRRSATYLMLANHLVKRLLPSSGITLAEEEGRKPSCSTTCFSLLVYLLMAIDLILYRQPTPLLTSEDFCFLALRFSLSLSLSFASLLCLRESEILIDFRRTTPGCRCSAEPRRMAALAAGLYL